MSEHVSLYIKDEDIIEAIKLAERYGANKSQLIVSVMDKELLMEKVGQLSNHITEDEERFNDIVYIYGKIKEQFYEEYKKYRQGRENLKNTEYTHDRALDWVEPHAEKLGTAPEILLNEFEKRWEEEQEQ